MDFQRHIRALAGVISECKFDNKIVALYSLTHMRCLKLKTFLLILLLSFMTLSPIHNASGDTVLLNAYDKKIISVISEIIALFRVHNNDIWPGYDLSKESFILYRPDKWALLINAKEKISDFGPSPAGWPVFSIPVLYHGGRYKDLVGQLSFNYKIGDKTAVAIPVLSSSEQISREEVKGVFGFIIHEAFHQYQGAHFTKSSYDPPREEEYPILDEENNAFASLEVILLKNALQGAIEKNRDKCLESMRKFIIVREYRWARDPSFIEPFEKSLEVVEATAKYVELKSQTIKGSSFYISETDMLKSLVKDLAEFIKEGSLVPRDMPRYRVYPVGAAEAFILDYLKIVWMKNAQAENDKFTFIQKMIAYLKPTDKQTDLDSIKNEYNYSRILSKAKAQIKQFQNQADEALSKFNNTPGIKVKVMVTSDSFNRSRSSGKGDERFHLERGAFVFDTNLRTFSLKTKNDFQLILKDRSVVDAKPDKTKRIVSFVHPSNTRTFFIVIDGIIHKLAESQSLKWYKSININEPGFEVSSTKPGELTFKPGKSDTDGDLLIQLK